jgi:hypothetical protein
VRGERREERGERREDSLTNRGHARSLVSANHFKRSGSEAITPVFKPIHHYYPAVWRIVCRLRPTIQPPTPPHTQTPKPKPKEKASRERERESESEEEEERGQGE